LIRSEPQQATVSEFRKMRHSTPDALDFVIVHHRQRRGTIVFDQDDRQIRRFADDLTY
jgi:hypothetical protein